jgi:hypothetical protein
VRYPGARTPIGVSGNLQSSQLWLLVNWCSLAKKADLLEDQQSDLIRDQQADLLKQSHNVEEGSHWPNLPNLLLEVSKPAQVGQFLWAVLTLRSDGSSCGGSLLSQRFVLSAAHCHEEGVVITRVRVGVTRVKREEEDTYRARGSRRSFKVGDPQVVEVPRAIVHLDYGKDSHGITLNDLVLLELKTPVTFSPLVQPICLPRGDELDKGISTVMGWGCCKKE